MKTSFAAAGAFSLLFACQSGESPASDHPATGKPPGAVNASRPVFLRGPTSGAPVAPFIADEIRKGRADRSAVLVYVGATWCEPCQRFHQAIERGELDTVLGGVRFVEFDLDADRQPLEHAGYQSRLIPLFALPRSDGTAGDLRIEGSIKGEAAVNQNLLPRIKELLSRARSGT